MFKRFQSFRPPPLFLPRVAGEDERGGIERSVAVERLEPPEKWRHGMKTSGLRTPLTASPALYALVFLFATPVYSQTPFYQGKTITIIQGRDPGGTGDMRVRAMIPFLQKYLPGNPNIVSEYMSGGGGRKAANHVYRSARPDGLMIGNPGLGMVAAAVLGESGVLYDLDKFFYLGSPYSSYHP